MRTPFFSATIRQSSETFSCWDFKYVGDADCIESPICLQVVSPKPAEPCVCENKQCAKKPAVTIKTDKQEYGQEETVSFTVSNNSDKSILFDPYPYIEKRDGEWAYISEPNGIMCPCGVLCEPLPPVILQLGESRAYSWDQTVVHCAPGPTGDSNIETAEPGVYRMHGKYEFEENSEDTTYTEILSDEFTIKPAVSMQTEKEEYVQGETVKAELMPSAPADYYYDAQMGPWNATGDPRITIEKMDGEKWSSIAYFCVVPCMKIDCETGFDAPCPALGPPRCEKLEDYSWEWDQNACDRVELDLNGQRCSAIEWTKAAFGTYRLKTTIFTEMEDETECGGEQVTIYSNEFSILPAVTINTDKGGYTQGETVKLTADFAEGEYEFYSLDLFRKNGGGWEKIVSSDYCAAECGSSEYCDDYLEICLHSISLCWPVKKGMIREWEQTYKEAKEPDCAWMNQLAENTEIPVCETTIKAGAGTYKYTAAYAEGDGIKCEAESVTEIESNEFTIK